MKMLPPKSAATKQRQGGSAVIIVVAVVAILMILTVANSRILAQLGREIRLVDERQKRRWTLQPPAAVPAPKNPAPACP